MFDKPDSILISDCYPTGIGSLRSRPECINAVFASSHLQGVLDLDPLVQPWARAGQTAGPTQPGLLYAATATHTTRLVTKP